jgi:hypothetical protein
MKIVINVTMDDFHKFARQTRAGYSNFFRAEMVLRF